jgi:chromosome segregation ATPase
MILFFTAMPLYAQDQSSGDAHQPPSADEIVSKMQSKLNLTQDQVTAITPIIEKYTSKREELRQSVEDGTADRDSMRSQMKELKADEGQELSQVLSADQLSQWQQMQSQGRHKHSGEGGGESGGEGSGNGGGTDNPPPQQ